MSGKLVRPPKNSEWRELFRLTDDGEFVPDDGQPARAFFGYLTSETTWDGRPFSFPVAFCYGTSRQVAYPDVQRKAMDACCTKYGCANGRRVNGKGQWS